jgi:predicted acylesterase/phospholipase RssA/tetratricopeptide (TPR) repeat protein
MPEKDFDLFLSYESADSVAALRLARKLVDHSVLVWVPAWELAPDKLTDEIRNEAILQSMAVGVCSGTRDEAVAKAHGIETISIDLAADQDIVCQTLAAKFPKRTAHARADYSDVVKNATNILRGEVPPDINVPLELVKGLKDLKKFAIARRLLEKIRPLYNPKASDEQRRLMTQQFALCTYKDPDLAADEKFDTALGILREIGDLRAITDQETLGLAGALHKYRFEALGQKPDLERSLSYYLRGYEIGPAKDFGYTSINAAFVLDLLARQEADDARQAGTESQTAKDRQAQARKIREELVDALPPMQYAPGSNLSRRWWFQVTVAEAFFGLARYDEAAYWLQKGKTRGVVEDWEYESTARQLASIARLHGPVEWNATAMEASPAWAVIKNFLGGYEAGVRSAFIGRVGLALSGGGFRASLFHIGVLARLAELDVLRHVEALSCVSGGSIIGAHYYLELRKLLHTKEQKDITRADYIAMVQRIERDFLAGVQRNIRTRMLAGFKSNFKMFLPMFFPNFSRTEYTGKLIEDEIFSKVQDRDATGQRERRLNKLTIQPIDEPENLEFSPKDQNWRRAVKVPILVLNATSLNTGHNWQFTATWMGEPPVGVDSKVDANYRLRRMYYDKQAPEKYKDFPLGHAVAASAAVPGLFEPLNLPGLYPDKIVRLVDGGVHDNQGVSSLLEQGCLVMLVSDASGQMDTVDKPGNGVLSTLLRSNSVLQARVRVAQYHDLDARRTSALLRSLMFLHLKKDVESAPVDWENCQDPIQPKPINVLTSFGVLKTVQRKLADIRTDLDSFHDIEAFALMTSGYRMATRWFEDNTNHGFPQLPPVETDWRFLSVETPMKMAADGFARQHNELIRLLKVSNCLAFKVWKLVPALKIVGFAILALLAIAILWAAFFRQDINLITLRELVVMALAAGAAYIVGENLVRVVRFRDTLQQILIGLGMCFGGVAIARLHLWFFDPLYLKLGKVEQLKKR